MQQITTPRLNKSIDVAKPKSILEMSDRELAEMDSYQNRNRGFNDDDKGIQLENSYFGEE